MNFIFNKCVNDGAAGATRPSRSDAPPSPLPRHPLAAARRILQSRNTSESISVFPFSQWAQQENRIRLKSVSPSSPFSSSFRFTQSLSYIALSVVVVLTGSRWVGFRRLWTRRSLLAASCNVVFHIGLEAISVNGREREPRGSFESATLVLLSRVHRFQLGETGDWVHHPRVFDFRCPLFKKSVVRLLLLRANLY